MLYEIKSDVFRIGETQREPFHFKPGLNTVIGGDEANNSIGKSTLLLIIDFVFGGDAYLKSDVIPKLKPHEIFFIYKFGNDYYHFIRNTIEKDIVYFCDNDYSSPQRKTLEEFKSFLYNKYNIGVSDYNFNFVTSRYFRIWKKENYLADRPLSVVAGEPNKNGVTELQKLLGMVERLSHLLEERNIAEKKKKAFNQARKNQVVSYKITNRKGYKENLIEIEKLKAMLAELIKIEDERLINDEIDKHSIGASLNDELTKLRREKYRYASKIKTISTKIKGEILPDQYDINKLNEFFPNQVNIERLNEVQNFHKGINEILTNEMLLSIERYRELINNIEIQISILQQKLNTLGIPKKVSKTFITKCNEINDKITILMAQNKAYEDQAFYQKDYSEKNEALNVERKNELTLNQKKINDELAKLNHFIYLDNRKPPYLDLYDGDSYKYITPDDGGTGTSYKSLIIFDLAILHLTPLPAITHDSFLLKNVGDAPIDKIIELYNSESKQVFISFDKLPAYSNETQLILENTKVVKLGPNEHSLFGKDLTNQ